MTNFLKRHRKWPIAVTAILASGCLGGGSSNGPSGGPGPEPPPASTNRPPAISGIPEAFLSVNEDFDFRPTASDPDDDALTFSIVNPPPWASFDPATGRLRGRPGDGDIGEFVDIAISVTDGEASATLNAFSVTVEQVGSGSVTLSWSPPTTNADGSALTGLAGYRIHYGRAADNLGQSIVIDNPGSTRWVVVGLSPATWYFAMTSVNDAGLESTRTAVGSITIS